MFCANIEQMLVSSASSALLINVLYVLYVLYIPMSKRDVVGVHMYLFPFPCGAGSTTHTRSFNATTVAQ